MVLTTHSLEPQRPWKREQLGAGYHYYRKILQALPGRKSLK
jgi:hypothetical protein